MANAFLTDMCYSSLMNLESKKMKPQDSGQKVFGWVIAVLLAAVGFGLWIWFGVKSAE